jgi:hypothetical protein
MEQALWWERHIVEVLRGLPPDAPQGAVPRPEYDPELVSLTRREQAKAAELTAAGRPVTASAVKQRRRRYEAGGLAAMADRRAVRRTPPHGRADQRVVEAMRQAIGEATDTSTRTALYIFWRAGEILEDTYGAEAVELPSRATLYRLFSSLSAGAHTTGSARTRRSLAARPDGQFSGLLNAHIDAMLTADPQIATAAIWEHLADNHGATVAYPTLRTYIASRRAASKPDKIN